MTEPLNFAEELRAWRRRNEARAAGWPVEAKPADNILPFPRCTAPGMEDESNGPIPWLDWLRAEPWVPVIED